MPHRVLRGSIAWLAILPLTLLPAQTESPAAAFARRLTNTRLVGSFTDGDQPGKLQEDSYTIRRVIPLEGGRWKVEARIEYGGRQLTVPIPVDLAFAGDTPMIQVTNLAIPLLGTFTARVLFHGDQYAGTWSGAEHGGHLFGRIEALPPVPAAGGVAGSPASSTGATEWRTWRGPTGTGSAPAGDPPVTWSETENIRWKAPLPGLGSGSPVQSGSKIFVLTAVATERTGQAPEGSEDGGGSGRGGRGGRGGGAPSEGRVHQFLVLCFDHASGKELWRTPVCEAVPHEGIHQTNSHASASPVTDGERVYAFFGSRGLYCLDLEGKVIWSKNFGLMRTRNQFGEGASPSLSGDHLIVNWDHEGESFIVALDKRTGEERWRRVRDEPSSWVTPLIAPVGARHQVIVTGTRTSLAYDLETGEPVWRATGMTANCIPSPIYDPATGNALLMSGFRGAAFQAVKLDGARGEIGGTEHLRWEHNRNTSYVPSALLHDGLVYFLRSNNGVLTCLDAKTGEVKYEGTKIEGLRSVYSSPVGVAGRVYICSREGTTVVVKAGPQLEVLATNQLDDVLDATPAVIGNTLVLRGGKMLYCIGKP